MVALKSKMATTINIKSWNEDFTSYKEIIPTQCFFRFFGDFDWSVGKIKLFLHFDKSPCVGIFDNCLDITVVDCVSTNNELYIKLYNFHQIKYS